MPEPSPSGPRMLDHALAYVRAGRPVFPVCSPRMGAHRHGKETCPRERWGKIPLVPWKAYQDRLPTEAETRDWWRTWPEANIGMATGALSGVVVLDADGTEARKAIMERGVPSTPVVWTGKVGGAHYWFAHPGHELRNFAKKLPGTDFRGDGGYVLLPPSLHEKGSRYRWAEGTERLPLATLPTWLEDLQRAPAMADGEHEPLDLGMVLGGIPDGQRNEVLFRFACKLRGDDVPQRYAELMVVQAAQACRPPYDEADPVGIVRRVYRDYPAGRERSVLARGASAPNGRPTSAPGGARLDVVRMVDVKPEPIEWLWRGRLARGKPTLLMGDPGLGKSLITHWTAATVSTGGGWPDGGRCARGGAILFTTEDGLADTVAPRLLAAGADMGRVVSVRGVIDEDAELSERMFALTEHLTLLERLIGEIGAVFVVMDPITAYLGPDVNSHKEADVRRVLGPLSLLAERTNVVLLMLMHLNKGTGVQALYRASGTIAFPAVARVVLGVAPDPNDEDGNRRLLLPIKMNIGVTGDGIGYRIETARGRILTQAADEDQPPVLLWDSEPVTITAADALDSSGTADEKTQKEAVKEVLRQYLVPGEHHGAKACFAQIKEVTGCGSGSVITKAKRELGVRSVRETNGTWSWVIPRREHSARARATEYGNQRNVESSGMENPVQHSHDSVDSHIPSRAHARASGDDDEDLHTLRPGAPDERVLEDAGEQGRPRSPLQDVQVDAEVPTELAGSSGVPEVPDGGDGKRPITLRCEDCNGPLDHDFQRWCMACHERRWPL